MSDTIKINIWNVFHGNAISIRNSKNEFYWIDIGKRNTNGDNFSPLNFAHSNLGMNQIDYIIFTHPHADHFEDINTIRNNNNWKPRVINRVKSISHKLIYEANGDNNRELIDNYLTFVEKYTHPVAEDQSPSNPEYNGGISIDIFNDDNVNDSSNLNDYSLVTVLKYYDNKMIIPGDIEKKGWNNLLENERFIDSIYNTDILIASHHGRDSGYFNELFNFISPKLTIISDGRVQNTDATSLYSNKSQGMDCINIKNNETNNRKVLTTRSDGNINVEMSSNSELRVSFHCFE